MSHYVRCPNLAREHGAASRLLSADISADLNAARILSTLTVWHAERSGRVPARVAGVTSSP